MKDEFKSCIQKEEKKEHFLVPDVYPIQSFVGLYWLRGCLFNLSLEEVSRHKRDEVILSSHDQGYENQVTDAKTSLEKNNHSITVHRNHIKMKS
ncbi:hypothetical protein H5410_013260 [Solanum commersonii]|uniref:Uncharacterized protein n=1 Tax=Solanum commersonii TaxID=4109 RepID=A0A9J6AUX6_SOLCO|nr:hypothetical protein H5410_013260 [Solanum commersonii]